MARNRFGSTRRLRAALLASTSLVLALALPVIGTTPAAAGDILVSDASQLSAAIAGAAAGDRILLQNNIALGTTLLPPVSANITIEGNGHTIDAQGNSRIFFLNSAATIQNITLVGGNAQGGAGGSGIGAGGGGLGAGGAIFVNTGNATISNVSFTNNSAAGGTAGVGGLGAGTPGGGGGGGLGGSGGTAGQNAGGGGGGYSGGGGGSGAPTDHASVSIPGGAGGHGPGGSGGDGGSGTSGSPGANGGGAGGAPGFYVGTYYTGGGGGGGGIGGGAGGSGTSSDLDGGGGGGGGGLAAGTGGAGGTHGAGTNGGIGGGGGGAGGNGGGDAGNGGDLGGGGGGTNSGNAGNAGFGGGGGGGGYNGSNGGNGGFGGGGGGTNSGPVGSGGVGGGNGSGRSGGGGAGFGGAVFVRDGASLTIGDGAFSGNSVSGGTDGFGLSSGAAAGSSLFLMSGTITTFNPTGTLTINGTIADDSAASLPGGTSVAGTGAGAAIAIAGGTVVLNGANTYSGGTTISASTVVVTNNSSVGAGAVTLDGGVFKAGADGLAFSNSFLLTAAAGNTIDTNGNTLSLSGVIGDASASPGALTKSGAGTLILSGVNTYSGGTTINAGTLQLAGAGTLGAITAETTVAGGTLDLGGTTQTQNGGLTLTGGSITNGTLSSSSLFDVRAGSIDAILTGSGALEKNGTGTVTLSGANSYTGGTTINAGTLTLTGAGTLGVISGATTVAGGTLDLGGTIQTQNGGLTLTGGSITNGTLSSSGLFDVQAGSIGAILAGSGALTKNGTGTVTLSGTNTFTGGTTINAGTLKLAGAGTLGVISGVTTVAGGTLDLGGTTQTQNGGVTLTGGSITNGTLSSSGLFDVRAGSIDATLAGSGALEKNGAGTVTLSGANTYTGGTTVNAGTLQLGNSTGVGSILGAITVGGSTTFDIVNADTSGITTITNSGTTYFHNSSTAGAVTIDNRNTLEFLDSSTAGSATITMGGVFSTGLTFRDSSSAGAATITNSNGSAVFANTSSAGSATITNFDSLYFADSATAGHATITNFGTMNFVQTSTAGSAAITNNSGLSFYGSATAGSATITNNGSGGLLFADSSTAGTASIFNNGVLAFNSIASAGNATITNNGGANLSFFDNSTAGNAAILNNAGGTVDFSASFGVAGNLSVGSLAGAGDVYLGAQALTVGGNNLSTTVSGVISDCGAGGTACNSFRTGGSLVKTGTGTLTLSGTNTYTGATTINGGTLAVNGDLTSSSGITVNNGGALGGTGTVGTTAIMSGGTLAPGNSVGTLTINGNLAFSTGSFYKVEASPTSADRTNVFGTATLTGATVQAVQLPGSFRAQTYTILNATGGFGGTQFAGLTGDTFAPGARNPHLTYDANNVFLVLDPGTLVLPNGASGNQTNVTGAINKFVESGGTPPAGFDALLNMSGAKLTNALNQVSGQPGATTTQGSFSAMQQFTAMINPLSGNAGSGQGGVMSFAGDALGYAAATSRDAKMRAAYAAVMPPAAPASLNERWGVWASGYGGSSTITGNSASGSSSTTSRIYGSVAGADYRVSQDTVVGFALGGAGFNFAVSDGLGSGRADLFQAGVYGRHAMGAAYISGTFAYGLQDVTTDRTVTVAGTDKLQANFKANTFTGRVESGYRLAPWPMFGATPYAAVQVSSFDLPGYRERAVSGSDQFALAYTAQTTTNVRTELGARADKLFLLDSGLFTLSGRLAWAHDSNTDRPVTAAFQSLPGASFTVNGAKPAADSALVTAGAEIKWLNGFSLGGTFEGEFSSTTQSYAGKSTLRYAW